MTVPLRAGESRVLCTKPCPPYMYSHPNEYYKLKSTARHALLDDFEGLWSGAASYRFSIFRAFLLLLELAESFPARPMRRWEEERMGNVLEVCCPNCRAVFRWEGHFYAPQFPQCKRWMHERRKDERAP